MTRLLVVFVVVGMLSGCRGPNAATPVDPFVFGPTRVAPPRTGCISGQPAADPYYSGTRQAAAPRAAESSPRPGTAPSATVPMAGSYAPPGGSYDFKGSSIDRSPAEAATGPGDLVTIPSAATTGAVATAGSSAGPGDRSRPAVAGRRTSEGLAGRERIIRQIEPRPKEEAAWSGGVSPRPSAGGPGGVPRPLPVPSGAIDIMDLPQAGSGNSTRFSSTGSAVRLVSGTEELDGSSGGQMPGGRRSDPIAGGTTSRFSSPARYGHDPNYEWLRGKLEYSQIERRWKLRYIPIDGSTDEFGGSVVFSDASLLAGYERGEFVEVRGELGDVTPGDGGYAPDFKVREIKRTGD